MNSLQELMDMLNGGEENPKLTVAQMIEDTAEGTLEIFTNPLLWIVSYGGALYVFKKEEGRTHIDAIQTVTVSLNSDKYPNTLKPITTADRVGAQAIEHYQEVFPLVSFGGIGKEGMEEAVALIKGVD